MRNRLSQTIRDGLYRQGLETQANHLARRWEGVSNARHPVCNCVHPIKSRKYMGRWACAACDKIIESLR